MALIVLGFGANNMVQVKSYYGGNTYWFKREELENW